MQQIQIPLAFEMTKLVKSVGLHHFGFTTISDYNLLAKNHLCLLKKILLVKQLF